jgi:hypothetical protein
LDAYLRSTGEAHTVQDALRWLRNMTSLQPSIKAVPSADTPPKEKKLVLPKVTALKHPALLNYLDARFIPHRLAKLYLREIWLCHKEKKKLVFALGFRNENGGYELRSPYLKISIKKKGSPSFVARRRNQTASTSLRVSWISSPPWHRKTASALPKTPSSSTRWR